MKNTAKTHYLAELLYKRLENCDICPRNCHVNRQKRENGYCNSPLEINAYTAFKHAGEEPGISNRGGSGTIFFSGCNLRCCYCQNYRFSQEPNGTTITPQQLASIMLNLEKNGADNINLVTPTHYMPQILSALDIAINNGLKIPIIYNTSGYEKSEIIALIEPAIDVYLADLRYADEKTALELSHARDYPQHNQAAIKEMYKQKPEVVIDDNGTIQSALIIRHLVLPNHIENTRKALTWINKNTPDALVSVMFQYQPYYKAKDNPAINRPVSKEEYAQVKLIIEDLEINGWVQDLNGRDELAGAYFKPNLEAYL